MKNYYYFVVGVLSILFAFTHAWSGQSTVLPILGETALDTDTKTVFFYVWHIISIENLVFGIAFVLMAFHKDMTKVRFAAWMIGTIMVARWLVIFGTTLFLNKSALAGILTDSIAIIIVVVLIFLGTRVKGKVSI